MMNGSLKFMAMIMVLFAGPAKEEGDGPGPEGIETKVFFEGSKFDPRICVEKKGEKKCCGMTKTSMCRGADYLHPSMKPLAACLQEKLHLGGEPAKCPGGIGESFRSFSLQKSYKSLSPGWSLHNYGLAFDACCYFKSHDCSKDNLINKAVGGIKTWKKNGRTRCQAAVRMDKSMKSKAVVEQVHGLKEFSEVLPLVKECYAEAGIPFGEWNWGIGWKDYFDAPHFQYFPSNEAGFYTKKSKRKNGAHFFVRLLKDCYEGNRLNMLEELYESKTPGIFIEKHKDDCGKAAFEMYMDFM